MTRTQLQRQLALVAVVTVVGLFLVGWIVLLFTASGLIGSWWQIRKRGGLQDEQDSAPPDISVSFREVLRGAIRPPVLWVLIFGAVIVALAGARRPLDAVFPAVIVVPLVLWISWDRARKQL